MTMEMMNLREFVEKTPDADFLREMIGFAAERLMELEVGAMTGAGYGKKDPARRVQRNGYRDRDRETRGGNGRSADPEAPEGQLFPRLPRAAPDGGEGSDGGGRSRATDPISGSMPPTSRCGAPAGSCRSPLSSPSVLTQTVGARFWGGTSGPPRPSRSHGIGREHLHRRRCA